MDLIDPVLDDGLRGQAPGPVIPRPGRRGCLRPGHGGVGGGFQVPPGPLLQDGGQRFQQVLHHPLAVGAHPGQVHPAQHLVKVVFGAEDIGEQRLDAAVVVGQQGQARLGAGVTLRQGGGLLLQLLVQGREGTEGVLSMARTNQPNSAGSQFFIMFR